MDTQTPAWRAWQSGDDMMNNSTARMEAKPQRQGQVPYSISTMVGLQTSVSTPMLNRDCPKYTVQSTGDYRILRNNLSSDISNVLEIENMDLQLSLPSRLLSKYDRCVVSKMNYDYSSSTWCRLCDEPKLESASMTSIEHEQTPKAGTKAPWRNGPQTTAVIHKMC